MDVDKIVNYMQRLIRRSTLNKYKTVLKEFNETSKGIYVDQWTLGETKNVTMERFWTWEKLYGIGQT